MLAGRIAVACEDVQVTVYLQEKLWAKQGAAPGQKEAVQGDTAREGGANLPLTHITNLLCINRNHRCGFIKNFLRKWQLPFHAMMP